MNTQSNALRFPHIVLLLQTNLFNLNLASQPQTYHTEKLNPLSLSLMTSVKKLRVQLTEEEPEDREVANLAFLVNGWPDTKHKSSTHSQNFNFRIFNSDPQAMYFMLDPSTGILRTAQRIDRDRLCPSITSCCDRSSRNQHQTKNLYSPEENELFDLSRTVGCFLELLIRSDDQYSQLIQVYVYIIDLNDNAPNWDYYFLTSTPGHKTFKSIEITVSESSPIGDYVILPTARDPDLGKHGVVRYVLTPEHDQFNLEWQSNFKSSKITSPDDTALPVEHELRLVVKRPLDREQIDKYELTLTAVDGAEQNGSVPLIITVTDANDNTPKFTKEIYVAELAENARPHHPVVQVRAEDADEGLNGQVKYHLSALTKPEFARLFTVDLVTGWIFVQWEIDYEQHKKIQLTLEATDTGHPQRASSCIVEIHVTDENDYAPEIRFEPAYLTNYAQVPENEPPGRLVAVFSATDVDSGENGHVTCQLLNHQLWNFVTSTPERLDANLTDSLRPLFKLQRMNVPFSLMYKLTTEDSFDRELFSRVTVSLVCSDNGTPQQNTTGSVSVRILDVNDNRPKFARSVYYQTVNEDAAVHSEVFVINATDDDEGANGKLTYWLSGSNADFFNVETNTGRVSIKHPLDRESQRVHHFTVYAADGGQTQLNSSTGVVVSVLDVNDNAPYLQQPVELSLFENHTVAKPFGKLEVVDLDEGKNADVTFTLINCIAVTLDGFIASNMAKTRTDCSKSFFIAKDGSVYLAHARLDREKIPNYKLTVRIEDHGSPSLATNALVRVRVLDVNDNSPIFLFPSLGNSTIYVNRDTSPGALLATLHATDADEFANGEITYELKNQFHVPELLRLFHLNPETGELKLKESFSRASVNFTVSNNSNATKLKTIDTEELSIFNLLFSATDNGQPPRSTTAVLRVLVSPPFYNPSTSHEKYGDGKRTIFGSQSIPTESTSWSLIRSSLDEDVTGISVLLGLVVMLGLFVCLFVLLIGSVIRHAQLTKFARQSSADKHKTVRHNSPPLGYHTLNFTDIAPNLNENFDSRVFDEG